MANEQESIEDLLRFDPFAEDDSSGGDDGQKAGGDDGSKPADDGAKGADDADGGGDAGSQQADGGQQQGAGDSGKPDDAAAGSGKPDESQAPANGEDERDKTIAFLKEQVQNLGTQLRAVQQQNQQGQQGQGQGQGQQGSSASADDPIPDYQFSIPSEIVEGIAAEDATTRSKALNMLVAGIGQSVHQHVREEYQKRLENVRTEVQQNVQQTSQQNSQVENIRKDYFGQHPNHDSEIVRPLVQKKSAEVMQEFNVNQWSPFVRDEIAKRVNAELTKAGFSGSPAPAGGGGGNAPTGGDGGTPPNGSDGAPHMRRSGSRPGGSGGGQGGANSQQDIDSTLFG